MDVCGYLNPWRLCLLPVGRKGDEAMAHMQLDGEPWAQAIPVNAAQPLVVRAHQQPCRYFEKCAVLRRSPDTCLAYRFAQWPRRYAALRVCLLSVSSAGGRRGHAHFDRAQPCLSPDNL